MRLRHSGFLAYAAGVALIAGTFNTCDTECIPTKSDARDAAVADLGTPRQSGVLQSTLTAKGEGLGFRRIEFSVPTKDGPRSVGSASTNEDGVARLDLKDRPLEAVDAIIAGNYQAVFGGDGTYCGSGDGAPFTILQR